MTDSIQLSHGNGGRHMRELIAQIFACHFNNPLLDTQRDAAVLPILTGQPCLTTDGFVVQPLEFPGGNIGTLAANGTLNDLAVAGAKPRYLTVSVIIEEGLKIAMLDRVIKSLACEATRHGVVVVAGDTKVVGRGEGGGLYLTTTGLGELQRQNLGMHQIQPGDAILVSGPVGDHGAAILMAREQFGLRSSLPSDCACVLPLTEAVLGLDGLRFMRDPTRGGLNTVAQEISQATGLCVRLRQQAIPIRPEVKTLCDILGFDSLNLASEGRVIAIVAPEHADTALTIWHQTEQGQGAAIIGQVESGRQCVILETPLGGDRLLSELESDPLPRIC